jgi:beta-lactamase superfamily II metal-dependent hydrolase
LFQHNRHQHAVGHGFFHTASVSHRDETCPPFNYVYDCGSKKSRLIAERVKAYTTSLGTQGLDLLVISHFHTDHVNGLGPLLTQKRVHTAIIPFVSAAERLLLVAYLCTKNNTTLDDFYLAAYPEQWLRDRNVDRVVTISSSDDNQGDDEQTNSETALPWKLTAGEQEKALSHRSTVPHETPIILKSNSFNTWEFLFFHWKDHAFLRTITDLITHYTDIEPNRIPEDPRSLLAALQDTVQRSALAHCYQEASRHKVNWTTLCMRSGPLGGGHNHSYAAQVGAYHCPAVPDVHRYAGAWLGTGDAELRGATANSFFDHYSGRHITCLSLPHHGSYGNFDSRLLSHFNPCIVFATCPASSRHHPNRKVKDAVDARGTFFVKVDESLGNQLHERFNFVPLNPYGN